MYLAGPEPHLDFGRRSFHCVNTAPSGIEIRAVGFRLVRGDTAASIEVCTPVTIGQRIRSKRHFVCVRFSLCVGGDYCLPSLVTTRCHCAIGGRMEGDTIRADVVDSLDYVDFTVG